MHSIPRLSNGCFINKQNIQSWRLFSLGDKQHASYLLATYTFEGKEYVCIYVLRTVLYVSDPNNQVR